MLLVLWSPVEPSAPCVPASLCASQVSVAAPGVCPRTVSCHLTAQTVTRRDTAAARLSGGAVLGSNSD